MGLTEHEINKRIDSTLDMIGLNHSVLDKSPFHLSRGTARLAALASVLAMRTKYLILDEPTVNMDSKSKKKILGVIRNLSEKVTVIYISHQIHEVSAISDQMCVLGHGRVLFSGSTAKYKQWAFKENKEDLLPVIDQVMYGLKELGMDVNTDVLGLDDAVSNIQTALKRGK
jgi:energy-coupling factor transport system ATP-binding protein